MKKRIVVATSAVALVAILVAGSLALAGGGKKHVKTDPLSGYLEGPPGPVSSIASGMFEATIDESASDNGPAIRYILTYADLEGVVQQAHIHFGQRSVSGGVSAFLCSNLGNGPAGTQACPSAPAANDEDQRDD